MTDISDPLAGYLTHLQARIRAQGRPGLDAEELLPETLSLMASREPAACLDLIVRALDEPVAAELVVAIGNGLLEDLLNENAAAIADGVAKELRRNKRFRQAFSFGNHASVDPSVIEEWVAIFRDLGTTKAKERKSTFRRNA